MISKEEFASEVEEKILSRKKEEWRAKTKNDKLLTIILLSVFSCMFVLFIILRRLLRMSIFLLPTALSVVAIFITSVIAIRRRNLRFFDFKIDSMGEILNILLQEYKYQYSPNSCLSEIVYNSSPFSKDYDFYSGEDFLSINIPNDDGTPSFVPFSLSDLYLTRTEKYTDEDGETHTTTVTVYKGAMGHAIFPFEFKCTLAVGGQLKGTAKLQLEDIEFNKNIKAYTDNDMEALVILTPSMINKLKDLKKVSKKFELYLYGSSLFLSFKKINLFEINRRAKFLSPQMFDKIYDNISLIVSIVEEIKTNNKIFKI